MKTLIVTLGCLLAVAAQARIGETPQQCVERYGKPLEVNKGDQSLSFSKNGLVIITEFHDGICEGIYYTKIKEAEEYRQKDFTLTEVEVLLGANGGDKKWNAQKDEVFSQAFFSDDVSLIAVWDKRRRYLNIVTLAHQKRRTEAKADKERQNLEGF